MDGTRQTPGVTLGEFLRTRRARLTPADAGIVSYGARRVPGLRREELAQLSGVSTTYYTRLEQGQSTNASPSVIDALARALQLDDDERDHLHRLARPARGRARSALRPERAAASVVRLLDAMDGVPAVLLGRRGDVLAWNRLGHALLGGHVAWDAPSRSAERPNLVRMLFLDPHTRDLYRRWADEASRAVASLRAVAGRYPDDRGLADLVGELCVASDRFAALWARHPVRTCTSGLKHFAHPEVGELELAFQVLHMPDDDGRRLITYTAEPGTPSSAALQLLGVHHASARLAPEAAVHRPG